MAMTYSTPSELKIYAQAIWESTDETYLEELRIFVPIHRAMKFQAWLKKQNFYCDIIEQSCTVNGKPGYRAFRFDLAPSYLDQLLIQFQRWGVIITNQHLRQCSDDLDREDLAVIEEEISTEGYSPEILAKVVQYMQSHPTADVNAVLEYLR